MVEGINGTTKVQTPVNVNNTKQKESNKGIVIFTKKGLTPAQERAVESLKEQIAKGNATYHNPGIIETVLNYMIDHKTGDYIRIENYADPNEKISLGDVKGILQLNLPPGSLLCNKTQRGGGNFDLYDAPQHDDGTYYIDIFVNDLAEGTGLSEKEIQVMFSFE